MKQTTKQLKAVRDNAPEGATHYAENFKFLAFNGNEKWMRYDPNGLNGFCWFKADDVNLKSIKYMHSLSDIAEIIELREQLAQTEKQVATAAYLMRECDEYLRINRCANIGHNSILHTKLWQMVDEIEGKG